MVISASDFIKLPTGFKYLIVFAILLGAGALTIPVIAINIGEILFIPVTLSLEFFGIFARFEMFVILFGILLIIIFQIWVLQILLVKK